MSDAAQAWPPAADAVLRGGLAVGTKLDDLALALGRSRSAFAARAGRLGLRSTKKLSSATRERIDELAAEGWATSRIARRLQLDVALIETVLKRSA